MAALQRGAGFLAVLLESSPPVGVPGSASSSPRSARMDEVPVGPGLHASFK